MESEGGQGFEKNTIPAGSYAFTDSGIVKDAVQAHSHFTYNVLL